MSKNDLPAPHPTKAPKPSRCLTPKDVARELSIGATKALETIRSMPGAFLVGKRWRITRLNFEAWLRAREAEERWRQEAEGRSWQPPSAIGPTPADEGYSIRRLKRRPSRRSGQS